ncbi:MAG: ComF family protein, partial [Gammaproteobacteria bacterium]
MFQQGRTMVKGILSRFYPAVCVLCNTSGHHLRDDLCPDCAADMPLNHHACRRCALPLPDSAVDGLCGRCLQQQPLYDRAWSPFIYAQPLEWMIHQFKFNAKLAMGRLLAELALQQLPAWLPKPDCLIPVPLHPRRLRERGFNQSLELAQHLAKRMQLDVDSVSCHRQVYTEPQTGKDARQRKKNVKGSFVFDNRRHYQHVAIFDDVITTGSTVTELTRVIKRTGVQRVDVW